MAHILVIDDEPLVRELLKAMLEGAGHEVTVAADGDAGMAAYRRRPADLVITDLIMPGKEGIETIRELVQGVPGIKIIAISGGGRLDPHGYLGLARKLGAARSLAKPFERRELLDTVAELLAE